MRRWGERKNLNGDTAAAALFSLFGGGGKRIFVSILYYTETGIETEEEESGLVGGTNEESNIFSGDFDRTHDAGAEQNGRVKLRTFWVAFFQRFDYRHRKYCWNT